MATFSTLGQRCLAVSLLLFVAFAVACSGGDAPEYETTPADASPPAEVRVPELSPMAQAGQAAFNVNCVLCHGPNASGTGLGPPLVHRIYEPGHHGDFSIRSAVRNGVPSHHWPFGDMPAIPGVSDADVENIICYLRELQRANDIFSGEAAPTVC